jgi:hypothetical protein
MKRAISTTAFLFLSVGIALSGCANQEPKALPTSIVASSDPRLPFQTMQEARTFTDVWALVTVTKEASGSVTKDNEVEGYIERSVTLETSATLWSRAKTATVPKTFDLTVLGYARKEGKNIPLIPESGVRFEVGTSYLVAFTVDQSGVNLPATSAVISLDGLGNVQAPSLASETPNFVRDLSGLAPAAAVKTIAAVKPLASDTATAEERFAAWERSIANGG